MRETSVRDVQMYGVDDLPNEISCESKVNTMSKFK